jgi:hypothetical protein
MRWWDCGKTHERYLGEVTANSRPENLAQAWRMVADQRMTNG